MTGMTASATPITLAKVPGRGHPHRAAGPPFDREGQRDRENVAQAQGRADTGQVHRRAQEPVDRVPGQVRQAEGDRGEQRYRDRGEGDVLAGEVSAQGAAAGQRRGLKNKGRPGLPDHVGVEDPNERGPEDRAGDQNASVLVLAHDGADRHGAHDDRGDAPVDQ
jgi:hypothetical protein